MRVMLLCLGLLLSGCGSYSDGSGLVVGGASDAAWGRINLIGHTLEYAEACIGPPVAHIPRKDGGHLTEWTTLDTATPISVPLPLVGNLPGFSAAVDVPVAAFSGALTAQVGGGSGRLMVVTDQNEIIREVHMAGPSGGLTGRDALIGRDLLRGCRRDSERDFLLKDGDRGRE
jgi:hypothetical protein